MWHQTWEQEWGAEGDSAWDAAPVRCLVPLDKGLYVLYKQIVYPL